MPFARAPAAAIRNLRGGAGGPFLGQIDFVWFFRVTPFVLSYEKLAFFQKSIAHNGDNTGEWEQTLENETTY